MWNWLSLVASGLLLFAAGQFSRVGFIGMWFLALGALSFGIVESLKNTGSDGTSSPNTHVTFSRFHTVNTKKPWCVETRYAVAYMLNENRSPMSATTVVSPSLTHTDPVLTVKEPGDNKVGIAWYRGDPPTFQMLPYYGMIRLSTENGFSEFVDTTNLCDIPFTPDPPPPPTAGGGQFGAWNVRAGQGVLPWCAGTRYRAQYVNGPNGEESLLSQPSLPFQSDEFSHPTMSVPPLDGYEVKWTGELMPDEWSITLPCTGVMNVCQPVGVIALTAPGVAMIGTVDFADVWIPGSPTLTMHIRNFVAAWNQKVQSTTIGSLRIREDGKLEMSAMQAPTVADITVAVAGQPWWQGMGFGLTGLRTNEPMVAEVIPGNRRQDAKIGSNVFIDVQNRCVS